MVNIKGSLMGTQRAFSKKDEDKTREELVNELEALRTHYTRLKAVAQRYESVAGKKDVFHDQYDLEVEKDRIETLRESERRFRNIYQQAPLGIALIDSITGQFMQINKKYCDIVGRTMDDMLTRNWQSITYPDDIQEDLDNMARLIGGEITDYKMEKRYIHANGSIVWVGLTVVPLWVVDSGYKRHIAMVEDITECKKADEALKESERKFRANFDQTFQFLGLLAVDGTLIEANRPALEYIGVREQDVIGKPFWDTPWWRHSAELQNRLKEAVKLAARGELVRFEATHTASDGSVNYFDFSIKPVADESGDIILLIAESRDITNRKRIEYELVHVASFPELNPNPIFEVDIVGNITYCNPATSQRFPDLQLRGMRHPMLKGITFDIFSGGEKNEFTRDVHIDDVDYQQSIRYLPDRKTIRVYSIDITDRKRAEEELRKLSRAVEESPATVVITDLKGDIEYANPKFTELTGYTLEEAKGKNPRILKSGHTPPSVYKRLWNTILSGREWRGEFQNKKKNGDLYWESAVISPIKDADGRIAHFIAIKEDITERKQAEEALRASEEKFRALADTSFDTIIVHRGDNLLYVNNPAVELTGYSKDEILKMQFWELFTEDDRETIKKLAFDRLAGKSTPTSYETRILTKDGRTKWINLTAGIFLFEGKPTVIATLFDMTGIKKVEKELKESKAQAELYLDLMGHDIRNMNQVGMGFLELALGSPNIDKKDKELLLKSMGALENSTRLIDNVRKLQKAQTGELKLHAVDACQDILRVLGHYSNIPGVKATFNYELPPGCTVMANDLLYEVFENLIGNAIKHAGPRPTIRIKYETTMLNGKNCDRFTVEDDGPGIPDNLKPNIFTRQLHSGAKTRGSGLGLFIVKSLVDSYGGQVWVEDRVPGDYAKGAKFVVLIPAIKID